MSCEYGIFNFWFYNWFIVFPLLSESDCQRISVPEKRSSQLSKTLEETLKDKDGLAYFIQYLEVRGAVNLVRFWLEAEIFRLSATERSSRSTVADLTAQISNDMDCMRLNGNDLSSEPSEKHAGGALLEMVNGPSCDHQPSVARHNYSGAHGHCQETGSALLPNASSATKVNYTDTGASDPQRSNCTSSDHPFVCNSSVAFSRLPPAVATGGCAPPAADSSPVLDDGDKTVGCAALALPQRSSSPRLRRNCCESLQKSKWFVINQSCQYCLSINLCRSLLHHWSICAAIGVKF